MLNDILDDPQKPYYLVIDKLDENWVEERVRFFIDKSSHRDGSRLFKVHNPKIILCLRYDLIDRVIQVTRSAGFKKKSMILCF